MWPPARLNTPALPRCWTSPGRRRHYGAVIAAFLSGYFACRWRKVPILPMFDLAGMGFLLGQGIGRWGNFVNQEAFGTNTTLPWGMYSEGTCNYLSSVQETLAAQGVAVDPLPAGAPHVFCMNPSGACWAFSCCGHI